jgi:hypothetical protein
LGGWTGSNQYDHWMYTLPVLAGNPFGGTATPALQLVDGGSAVYEPRPDGATGLTWPADADLARTPGDQFGMGADMNPDGSMQHTTAAALWPATGSTNVLLGQTGWTLPTTAQLDGLYLAIQAAGDAPSSAPIVTVPDTRLHALSDIQPYLYWSCAGRPPLPGCHGAPVTATATPQQWSVSFGSGFLGTDLVPRNAAGSGTRNFARER